MAEDCFGILNPTRSAPNEANGARVLDFSKAIIGTAKWRFEADGQSSNLLMEAVMVKLPPTPSGEVG